MDLMDYRRKVIASSPHLSHAEGAVVTFADGTDLPLKSLIVDIDPVQSGTGDPSPTNVRPISGWDAVGVQTAGINLFDKSRAQSGYFSPDMSEAGGESSNRYRSNYIKCTPGTPYYFENGVPSSATTRGVWYDRYKHPIRPVIISPNTSTSGTDTAPENAAYLRAVCYKTDADIFMIAKGTTAASFEPYTGTSLTVQLGRTVYGGTLDVVSGELVADRKYEIFDGSADETWYTYSSTGFRVPKTDIGQSGNGICNLAPTVSSASSYGVMFSANAKYIYFFQAVSRWGVSTVANLRTWLATNNVEVCYELAEPVTYHLDPQTVRSLVGQNNIFADTGNTSLDYWAHP